MGQDQGRHPRVVPVPERFQLELDNAIRRGRRGRGNRVVDISDPRTSLLDSNADTLRRQLPPCSQTWPPPRRSRGPTLDATVTRDIPADAGAGHAETAARLGPPGIDTARGQERTAPRRTPLRRARGAGGSSARSRRRRSSERRPQNTRRIERSHADPAAPDRRRWPGDGVSVEGRVRRVRRAHRGQHRGRARADRLRARGAGTTPRRDRQLDDRSEPPRPGVEHPERARGRRDGGNALAQMRARSSGRGGPSRRPDAPDRGREPAQRDARRAQRELGRERGTCSASPRSPRSPARRRSRSSPRRRGRGSVPRGDPGRPGPRRDRPALGVSAQPTEPAASEAGWRWGGRSGGAAARRAPGP